LKISGLNTPTVNAQGDDSQAHMALILTEKSNSL
jgi:hypothetical protein